MTHSARDDADPAMGCCYEVDAADRIVSVGGLWTSFAESNGGQALTHRAVVGTLLWDHVHGLENRLVFKQVMDAVRDSRTCVEMSFRCDSPTCRRDMKLRIKPGKNGGCRFATTLVATRKRAHIPFIDALAPHGRQCVLVCNWCMSIELGGAWEDVDKAWSLREIPHAEPTPQPVFTICPACLDRIVAALP